MKYQLYSEARMGWIDPVLVVDKIGLLASIYRYAHIVFMGGSLIAHGGQSPIEAATEAKPIVHGPHVANFDELYRKLDQTEGAIRITSEADLYEAIKMLLDVPARRLDIGTRAESLINSMKGATERTLDYVTHWIVDEKQELKLALNDL